MKNLVRNTIGLRDALFEEWELLREGTSNPARARSIAMMANTILQSVEVEIEYHKYVSSIEAGSKASAAKTIELSTTNVQLGAEEKKIEEKKAA